MAASAALVSMLGESLVRAGGEVVSTADALAGKDAVGLYFSAHWCPPCRGFTPQLAQKYEDLKKAGKNFEVVFISSDKNEEAWREYHEQMPWLALPYADRDSKDALSKRFGVSGIPTLVILDATGNLITDEGRGAVTAKSFIEDYPFHPKPLNDLGDTTSGIQGSAGRPVVICLMEGASAEARAAAEAVMQEAAGAHMALPHDTRTVSAFFTGKGGGPLGILRRGCSFPAVVTPHEHPLKEIENNMRWQCDGCGKSGNRLKGETRHNCEECNFDYCGTCMQQSSIELDEATKAPLLFALSLEQDAFWVPSDGAAEVTAENVKAFIADLAAGDKLIKKDFKLNED